MRWLICLMMVLVAAGSLATDYIPLEGGVTWTYEAREPVTGMRVHALSGPGMWQGLMGYAQVEIENGVPLATTHWAHDDDGRLLLQGVDWGSDAAGGTWILDPAPVFADPSLMPQESVTTTAGLWEVTDTGRLWYGERQATVLCQDRFTYNLPGFGWLDGTELDVDWPDSPEPAPWAYGQYDTRTYFHGCGLSIIANNLNPDVVWDLADVDGLEVTDAPSASLGSTLVAAPTPFNPTTVFKVSLPEGGQARLDIHDVRGRRVDTLVQGMLTAGQHTITWQPRGLASGVYVAQLVVGRQVVTTRVTLLE